MLIDERSQRPFRDRTNLLSFDRSILQKKKSRYATDVVFHRRLRILINVYLYHFKPILVLVCYGGQDRCDHLARPTPLCPKIHQYRTFGFHNVVLKFTIGRMQNMISHLQLPPVLGHLL